MCCRRSSHSDKFGRFGLSNAVSWTWYFTRLLISCKFARSILAAKYRGDRYSFARASRHAIVVNRGAGRTTVDGRSSRAAAAGMQSDHLCQRVYQGRWEMEIMAFAPVGTADSSRNPKQRERVA